MLVKPLSFTRMFRVFFRQASRLHTCSAGRELIHERHCTPMTALTVPPRPAMRLFFAAFLMLFLELVLIRYLAGSVWNMGYFPNLVLMGVFIGMGLGFVCHQSVSERRSPVLVQAAAFLLALLVIFLYC